LVVANFAARLAIQQAIAAQPHTLKTAAQATEFGAGAFFFGAVALLASKARVRGCHV